MTAYNRKILIVEDDDALQLLYKLKFKHEGFDVSTATNGNEGLELAKSFEPDIMLVDLLLPEMNGTEMLSLIRSHQWGSNIRVIIITNISKDEAPQALRFFNIDRYVVKAHFTPAQIVDIVRDVLGDKS
jgi:DNA-binding response OmpR family regulator